MVVTEAGCCHQHRAQWAFSLSVSGGYSRGGDTVSLVDVDSRIFCLYLCVGEDIWDCRPLW